MYIKNVFKITEKFQKSEKCEMNIIGKKVARTKILRISEKLIKR